MNGLSWAKVASALFALLVGVVVYVWVDHVHAFRQFQEDTKANFAKLEVLIKASGSHK